MKPFHVMVPRDVSLISLDDHPAFEWFKPEVSRMHTDTRLGAQGGAVGG